MDRVPMGMACHVPADSRQCMGGLMCACRLMSMCGRPAECLLLHVGVCARPHVCLLVHVSVWEVGCVPSDSCQCVCACTGCPSRTVLLPTGAVLCPKYCTTFKKGRSTHPTCFGRLWPDEVRGTVSISCTRVLLTCSYEFVQALR